MYRRPPPRRKQPAPRASEVHKYDAPIAGWISNRSLSSPMSIGETQGAAVLDNFFPTSTTAVLRRGKQAYATLGDGTLPVTSIFSYLNGLNRRLFASTQNTIYDITTIANATNWYLVDHLGNPIVTEDGDQFGEWSTDGLDVLTGASGGNWVTVQFATTGGIYLIGVNGNSTGFIYDGENFYPYTAGGVSELTYTNLLGPFAAGETLTGSTSGATATILRVINTGPTTGRLLINNVTGTFSASEIILDSGVGGATNTAAQTQFIPGITFPGGLTTADMSYVWVYKNRLWFIERDSLNAYYANDVDAFGGSFDIYPLGGILNRGGYLLWGQPWALDSGAEGGLSDQMVITSSEGEVAVFQGTYPEDTATWKPVGVYRIGKPLGNRAHFRGGGDIAVATSVGLVPLSKAITLDVTALSPAAVSYNVQDAWQQAVDNRGLDDWQCEIWSERKMAVISPPITPGANDPILFISNTETGAWCRYTGWNARAMDVFQGELYFGGPDGMIFRANVTGADNNATYTGVYVPLFDDLGTPASLKVPKVGRGVTRANTSINYSLSFQGNFNMTVPPPPTATAIAGGNAWGTAVWGQSVWAAENPTAITETWKSIGGTGYSVSMGYQVTSGSDMPLDVEIIRLEMTYTTAEVVS